MGDPYQVRLWEAARKGSVAGLRVQVEALASVDAPDYRGDHKGRTALMHAAANGHLEAVDYLIRAGARVDLKDLGRRERLSQFRLSNGARFLPAGAQGSV